jgi:hypothetical protein
MAILINQFQLYQMKKDMSPPVGEDTPISIKEES